MTEAPRFFERPGSTRRSALRRVAVAAAGIGWGMPLFAAARTLPAPDAT